MARIGIDIGGTALKAGVVTEDGRLLNKVFRLTHSERGVDAIIDDIAGVARDAAADAGLSMEDITVVGAGCPGTCNVHTGIVEYANNIGFVGVPLCDRLQTLLQKPVWVDNDANAAVLGEHLAGAAKGARDCVSITLGTGVGGGVLIGGKLLRGTNCSGGELGHMVIAMDGNPCSCGRIGCWESYASVTALIRQTKEAMKVYPNSLLWKCAASLDEVNGRTAFDAMRQGDKIATEVLDAYRRYIAVGLVNIINIFQPEVLCIGGSISREGHTLIEPVEQIVKRERYSRYADTQTRLTVSELGNRAGIIGAAFLDKQAESV